MLEDCLTPFKLLTDYGRTNFIWLSCLSKPRTLREISKIWGYDSGLYRRLGDRKVQICEKCGYKKEHHILSKTCIKCGNKFKEGYTELNFVDSMVNCGILKKVIAKGRSRPYYTMTKWIPEVLIDSEVEHFPNEKRIKLIKKYRKTIIKFFDSEICRKVIYNVEALNILFSLQTYHKDLASTRKAIASLSRKGYSHTELKRFHEPEYSSIVYLFYLPVNTFSQLIKDYRDVDFESELKRLNEFINGLKHELEKIKEEGCVPKILYLFPYGFPIKKDFITLTRVFSAADIYKIISNLSKGYFGMSFEEIREMALMEDKKLKHSKKSKLLSFNLDKKRKYKIIIVPEKPMGFDDYEKGFISIRFLLMHTFQKKLKEIYGELPNINQIKGLEETLKIFSIT